MARVQNVYLDARSFLGVGWRLANSFPSSLTDQVKTLEREAAPVERDISHLTKQKEVNQSINQLTQAREATLASKATASP